MHRVTISMSDAFTETLDTFMAENGYTNRSEAMRDLALLGLDHANASRSRPGACVAAMTYIYDHGVRDIPKRLAAAFHDHHDLSVATLHVHLDHDHCLEVAVLRGDGAAIKGFSQQIIAERGVRHGQVNFIPVDVEDDVHAHGHGRDPAGHLHVHPKG